MTHSVIVVVRRKRRLRAEPANVRQTLGRAALGHEYVRKEPEQLCRPRDAAPMVAIRRRHERERAQPLAILRLLEILIGHLALGDVEILREIACDRIARPEPLERVQPEPLALILHREPPEPQSLRETPEIGERCRLIVRQTPMKPQRTRRSLRSECGDIRERFLRMYELYCFDRFVHDAFPPDQQ